MFVFWWDCGWSPERKEEESPLNLSCPKTQTPCVGCWEKPVCSEAAPASCWTLCHTHGCCDACHGSLSSMHSLGECHSLGEKQRGEGLSAQVMSPGSRAGLRVEGTTLTSPSLCKGTGGRDSAKPTSLRAHLFATPHPQPFCSCL